MAARAENVTINKDGAVNAEGEVSAGYPFRVQSGVVEVEISTDSTDKQWTVAYEYERNEIQDLIASALGKSVEVVDGKLVETVRERVRRSVKDVFTEPEEGARAESGDVKEDPTPPRRSRFRRGVRAVGQGLGAMGRFANEKVRPAMGKAGRWTGRKLGEGFDSLMARMQRKGLTEFLEEVIRQELIKAERAEAEKPKTKPKVTETEAEKRNRIEGTIRSALTARYVKEVTYLEAEDRPAEFAAILDTAFAKVKKELIEKELPQMLKEGLSRQAMVGRLVGKGLLPPDRAQAYWTFRKIHPLRTSVKNFLFGRPNTLRRHLTVFGPLALGAVGVAGGIVVASEVLGAVKEGILGTARVAGQAFKGAFKTPAALTQTVKQRWKNATNFTWKAKASKKDAVNKTDKWHNKIWKRTKNAGRYLGDGVKFGLNGLVTGPALALATLEGAVEGLGRGIIGLNPAGKHEPLITKPDTKGFTHAVRGGITGMGLELWNTLKEEKEVAVEAAQTGPFSGAFTKDPSRPGFWGTVLPHMMSIPHLIGLWRTLRAENPAYLSQALQYFATAKSGSASSVRPPRSSAAGPAPAATPAGGPGDGHSHAQAA